MIKIKNPSKIKWRGIEYTFYFACLCGSTNLEIYSTDNENIFLMVCQDCNREEERFISSEMLTLLK